MKACLLLGSLLALAACDRSEPSQRMELADIGSAEALMAGQSPDTEGATWSVTPDGKAISFARDPRDPFLTLACRIGKGVAAPALTVIRHTRSDPGGKALFAVVGNGMVARFKVDATLAKPGWRWEATYPAAASEFEVFLGPREMQATLPGGGMLQIGGSEIPRAFVEWCRRNGKAEAVASDPKESESPELRPS